MRELSGHAEGRIEKLLTFVFLPSSTMQGNLSKGIDKKTVIIEGTGRVY